MNRLMKNMALVLITVMSCAACQHTQNSQQKGLYEQLEVPRAEVIEKHYYVDFQGDALKRGEEVTLKRTFQDIKFDHVEAVSILVADETQTVRMANLKKAVEKNGLKVDSYGFEASLGNHGLVIVEEFSGITDGCLDAQHLEFGCANNWNLAAMVVDPNDLNIGREADAADGHQAVNAINRYRTGEIIDIRRDDGLSGSEQ